jgi:hypothetical protein
MPSTAIPIPSMQSTHAQLSTWSWSRMRMRKRQSSVVPGNCGAAIVPGCVRNQPPGRLRSIKHILRGGHGTVVVDRLARPWRLARRLVGCLVWGPPMEAALPTWAWLSCMVISARGGLGPATFHRTAALRTVRIHVRPARLPHRTKRELRCRTLVGRPALSRCGRKHNGPVRACSYPSRSSIAVGVH